MRGSGLLWPKPPPHRVQEGSGDRRTGAPATHAHPAHTTGGIELPLARVRARGGAGRGREPVGFGWYVTAKRGSALCRVSTAGPTTDVGQAARLSPRWQQLTQKLYKENGALEQRLRRFAQKGDTPATPPATTTTTIPPCLVKILVALAEGLCTGLDSSGAGARTVPAAAPAPPRVRQALTNLMILTKRRVIIGPRMARRGAAELRPPWRPAAMESGRCVVAA